MSLHSEDANVRLVKGQKTGIHFAGIDRGWARCKQIITDHKEQMRVSKQLGRADEANV